MRTYTFSYRPASALAALALALAALLTVLSPLERSALADGGGFGSGGGTSSPAAKLTGQYIEFCSCDRVCESIFLDANRRGCASVCALKIEAGQRGEVSLAGVSVAIVVQDPGASASGKAAATPVLYVDRTASATQVDAIRALLAERFGARFGLTTSTAVKPAKVSVSRTTEALEVGVEDVATLRGRPLTNGYRRTVQIENAPNGVISYPNLGRGQSGQLTDGAGRVAFSAEGHSVLFGKFDFGAPTRKR